MLALFLSFHLGLTLVILCRIIGAGLIARYEQQAVLQRGVNSGSKATECYYYYSRPAVAGGIHAHHQQLIDYWLFPLKIHLTAQV